MSSTDGLNPDLSLIKIDEIILFSHIEFISKDFKAIFNDFKKFLISLRAQKTREAYTRDFAEFLIFTQNLGLKIESSSQINEKILLVWQSHLIKNHQRFEKSRNATVNASVARKLSGVSSFLEYLTKRSQIESNPMKLISRPTVTKSSKTNALTKDEVFAILNNLKSQCIQCKNESSRKYSHSRLHYVVIATLLTVGMRVEELCQLKIGDLEKVGDGFKLHLLLKGGRRHAPYIPDSTAQLINEYISEFRPHASNADPLFIRAQKVDTSTYLHRSSVYDMVVSAAHAAFIGKAISPHSCRATLATLLHLKKIPIGQIQDLLGHRNIETTALYLKKTFEIEDSAALKQSFLPKL